MKILWVIPPQLFLNQKLKSKRIKQNFILKNVRHVTQVPSNINIEYNNNNNNKIFNKYLYSNSNSNCNMNIPYWYCNFIGIFILSPMVGERIYRAFFYIQMRLGLCIWIPELLSEMEHCAEHQHEYQYAYADARSGPADTFLYCPIHRHPTRRDLSSSHRHERRYD